MKAFTIKIRIKVFKKTKGKCFYCGMKLVLDSYHIDHAHPKSKGGSDDINNLLPSCGTCNLQKGCLTIEGYRAALTERVLVPLKKAHIILNKNNHLNDEDKCNLSNKIADIHNEYMKMKFYFFGDDLGIF